MFGLLIGALFFGRPELVLLVGIGSAIPDLDREYAFFSREKYRDHQIHRALCHNYLFIALVYLVSPYLALGAFLHTLLDALTTAKDRGVEWLYPFSRFIKKAANDEKGNSLRTSKHGVYLYQYDPIEITRKSDRDLKEEEPSPWRRTYGPALSGGLLDQGVFFGSLCLFIIWVVWTWLATGAIPGVESSSYQFSVMLPIVIGSVGIGINMLAGELDRRRRIDDEEKPRHAYEFVFSGSLFMMLFAIVLGAYLNPGSLSGIQTLLLPIIVGAVVIITIAYVMPKIYKKVGMIRVSHHSEDTDDKVIKQDEPTIV